MIFQAKQILNQNIHFLKGKNKTHTRLFMFEKTNKQTNNQNTVHRAQSLHSKTPIPSVTYSLNSRDLFLSLIDLLK